MERISTVYRRDLLYIPGSVQWEGKAENKLCGVEVDVLTEHL